MNKLFKTIGSYFGQHASEILAGVGIGGFIFTTVLAVKVTPKVMQKLEQRKGDLGVETLPMKETAKVVVAGYVAPIMTGMLSTACVVSSCAVGNRKNASLMAAYTLSETALKTYQDKVVETLGESKAATIKNEVVSNEISRNPPTKTEVHITEKGNTLCFDRLSGRYFMSDIDKLKKIENELNRVMRDEDFISLNDFYDEVGLEHVDLGSDLGWRMDDGYIDIEFTSHLTPDGAPCLALSYRVMPRYYY